MLLWAGVGIVVLVLGAVGAVVGRDLADRPPGERLRGIRDWQPLIGAVLGFLGAAGVLVSSNVIQAETARVRSDQAAHAIGMALALEAERISTGVRAGLVIGARATGSTDADVGGTCRTYAGTLRRVLIAETPVYNAVLSRVGEFGDYNLGVFVRFYAAYADLLRALGDPDMDTYCAAEGADEVGYMVRQLQGSMDFYAIIAKVYGTVPPEATSGVGITPEGAAPVATGS